jgi:hypothetical protein
MELRPAITTGENRYANGDFDCTQQRGKVLGVQFCNQGVNSRVVLSVGGVEIELPSGSSRQGATHSFIMPSGSYDRSTYKFKFENEGGAASQVNNLAIVVIKDQP